MKILKGLQKFANKKWYPYLVAILAAADAFVVFIPTEALLISAVLVHPRKWISTALWISLGSAIGAAFLGYGVSIYGEGVIHHFFPSLLESQEWIHSTEVIQKYGLWGLGLVSLSPLPQHAAVILAGLAHMSFIQIFLSVLLGRVLKYLLFAWGSFHAPKLLNKLIPRRGNQH